MLIRSSITAQRMKSIPRIVLVSLFLFLGACNTSQQRNADTEVLESIQGSLEEAAATLDTAPVAPSQAEIDAILPSVFLADEIAAPVEERFNIVANRENAQNFFANVVAGTDFGVAVSLSSRER